MPAFLEVKGASQLRSALKRAEADMTQLSELHKQAAAIVVKRSRPPHRTGRLAGTVKATATRTKATVKAGTSSVPYAPVIHWGWSRRGIRAQPWLSDAAVASEPIWTETYREGIQAIVDNVGEQVTGA